MSKRIGLSMFFVASIGVNTVWAYEDASTLPEDFKFYGRVNVSLQRDHDFDVRPNPANNEISQQNMWHSNASRAGIKGKFTLDTDWSFIYKGELEIDANNGYNKQNSFIERREVYAGVTSKTFGSVMGGKIDTPLKMLQGKVDMFSDLTPGDMKYLIQGKTRDSHTYLYMTPNWSGVTASIATINFKEEEKNLGLVHDTGSSMSLTYTTDKIFTDKDKFYVGIARNLDVRDVTANRFAAQYKWNMFTVGGLVQHAERTSPGKRYSTGDDSEDGHLLNAAWNVTENDTVKLQWGRSQQVENSGVQKAIGYDHQFIKHIKAYVFHARIDGDYYQTASPAKQKDRTVMSNGIGVEYNF